MPAPDLVGRDFTVARPDVKWCGDVTCMRTWDGRAYLATVIGLHSRKVIGLGCRRSHADPDLRQSVVVTTQSR